MKSIGCTGAESVLLSATMKVKVDQNLCTGCELCVGLSPRLFKMDGLYARELSDQVPADLKTECQDTADACPVAAIEFPGG